VLDTTITGILHIHVAFDWGDEVDLERARQLVPSEHQDLPRRRRTPSSIKFRPPPLRFVLGPVPLSLPGVGDVTPSAEATVFDFAAVSTELRVPFSLTAAALTRLAGWLAEPSSLVRASLKALRPLYDKLLPAIKDPEWRDDFSEEYFVFQLPPGPPLPNPERLLVEEAPWLASLLRLEADPLSDDEVKDSLRLHLSYSPEDLLIPDWAAAVLIDHDCEETLQAIEFANLQLLEYRAIDNRLDDSLVSAYSLLHPLAKSRLPLFRGPSRGLQALGDLKLEASVLFERTGNVLKLVGDQYLARVFQLLVQRFHVEEWRDSIQRKLEVAEGTYQVVSDQASSNRMELLEIVVIVLILVEVILALVRH
jgi:hypothetical protein